MVIISQIMKLTELDVKISKKYSDRLLNPIKFGENSVNFWFPGSGMTTVLKDVFNNKRLLKAKLGKIYNLLKIEMFWGHNATKKTLLDMLRLNNFSSPQELFSSCKSLLDKGQEIVYIVSRVDDYPEKEKVLILKTLVNLTSLNTRRVHIIFNSIDKPWFLYQLRKSPEFMVLANHITIVPVLEGDLLDEYFEAKSLEYGWNMKSKEKEYAKSVYGGILQLSKEYIRSKGNKLNTSLKFKFLWDQLPSEYKDHIENPVRNGEARTDLIALGVNHLKFYSENSSILSQSSKDKIYKVLNKEEQKLLSYLEASQNIIIPRSVVSGLIRPNNSENLTDWAFDKAISRFRRKLIEIDIDSSKLKTLKGKGYIWQ